MYSFAFRPLLRSFSPSYKLQLIRKHPFHRASIMAKEFQLKGLVSLDLKPGEKKEVEVEGLEGAKVLLVNASNKISAFSPKCTHYGAPVSILQSAIIRFANECSWSKVFCMEQGSLVHGMGLALMLQPAMLKVC
jgi:nitrite reductase/ring-hydroxylating ferredoxin subunit